MAYELRADKNGPAVATLNAQGDAVVAAIGVLRMQKMDRATLSWDDEGVLALTKPGSKAPMLYVVKTDLRVGPKAPKVAEPSAVPRGRPKKDQTDLSLQAMPLGVGVWHELKGKDQRLYALPRPAPKPVANPTKGDVVARNFVPDSASVMALYCDEAGHVLQTEGFKPRKPVVAGVNMLKINTTDEARKNLRNESEFPWPANATHVLVGTEKAGQFTGRWLFRKS